MIVVVVQVGALKKMCSSSEGAQEKTKEGMKFNLPPKPCISEFHAHPLECECTFWQVFFVESHAVLDQTQGSGAVFS